MIEVNIYTSVKGVREEPILCNCGTQLIYKKALYAKKYPYCPNCKDYIGFTIIEPKDNKTT